MKKTSALFISGLFILCLSVSSHAQSSENELDQVELMKQFIGKWAAEAGKDSTWLWEITPSNKGYVHAFYLQVKGKTVLTYGGIIGFGDEYRNVNLFILGPNGFITRDIGGFVSDNEYIAERFPAEHKKTVLETWDCTFITPDKFKAIRKVKGVKKGELIYISVKE
jgi:hypothetical protein